VKLDDAQQQDVENLLSHKRWMLLHDMGVGKTPPAVVAASQRTPCLVTVPAYLIPQWEEYIKTWAPGKTFASMNEDGFEKRNAALHRGADFIFTSYHNWAAQKRYDGFWKLKWGSMIFDEAHRLRGRNSKWTKAVWTMQNSESKNKDVPIWMLTGTPIVRDGGDVFPLLKLCDKGIYRGYWAFVERWCEMIETPWQKEVGPIKDPEGFYQMLSRHSSRREMRGLEEIVYKDIPVDLPPSVMQTIARLKKTFILQHPDIEDPKWFTAAGAVWAEIRQLVSNPPTKVNPKMDALGDMFEDLPNERVIVACWFKKTAFEAASVIAKKTKRNVGVFTGEASASAREEAIRVYNENDDGVIVCTIAAMKEGVNLQKGRHTIFLEESELHADNAQLIGRQHRRGQDRTVIVSRIYGRRTVDEKVHTLAAKRDADAKSVMQEFFRETS